MAAEPPIRLVNGTFTYKKGEEDKTLDFYANYIKWNNTIQLVIQSFSPTVFKVAKDLLLDYLDRTGLGTYMVIELSRMEYTNFIVTVLNKEGIQLSVKDKTDNKYKPFPGTWSGEIIHELPPIPNSPSSCSISGGRRRTRRRKHKRRSTRRRHHRR